MSVASFIRWIKTQCQNQTQLWIDGGWFILFFRGHHQTSESFGRICDGKKWLEAFSSYLNFDLFSLLLGAGIFLVCTELFTNFFLFQFFTGISFVFIEMRVFITVTNTPENLRWWSWFQPDFSVFTSMIFHQGYTQAFLFSAEIFLLGGRPRRIEERFEVRWKMFLQRSPLVPETDADKLRFARLEHSQKD